MAGACGAEHIPLFKMLFEQKNLVSLFTANDIPFVIIKGMAAAVYYPNPLLRTMEILIL